MELDRLYNTDCIKGMSKIPEASIDLAFADPPFNIGYTYDVYKDRLAADEYLAWTKEWGAALTRTLKPTGTAWLAIGDDFAAELKLIFQRELGLYCRSWVIWYYTFGVNCKNKFTRSHTHLFHFVKHPKNFTFNADDVDVRVPSARQLVYGDARANSKGRLPDDTWILRPQDAAECFTPTEDVWYYSRVCGTFKERAGWHGCQMPEQLLGRIIRACSNEGETVLDPFGGSGTTLAVAKKLKRRYIGFELSKNYAKQIQTRLNAAKIGDPLIGPEVPQASSPPTTNKVKRPAVKRAAVAPIVRRSTPSDIDRGIVESFIAVRNGFPVDRVIADPELNGQFIELCTRLGLPGKVFDWNHRLMNLRKAGHFKGLPKSSRTTFPMTEKEYDRYKFACEIAIQYFERKLDSTLDRILCDPKLARSFDRYVLSMIPDKPTSLQIRWSALRFRKLARRPKTINKPIAIARKAHKPFDLNISRVPAEPGLYWLTSEAKRRLYFGETDNLQRRFEGQFGHDKFSFWDVPTNELCVSFRTVTTSPVERRKHQSHWISKWAPIGNYIAPAARR